eukprot:2630826-Pyramimonas_sp.AAC.1
MSLTTQRAMHMPRVAELGPRSNHSTYSTDGPKDSEMKYRRLSARIANIFKMALTDNALGLTTCPKKKKEEKGGERPSRLSHRDCPS